MHNAPHNAMHSWADYYTLPELVQAFAAAPPGPWEKPPSLSEGDYDRIKNKHGQFKPDTHLRLSASATLHLAYYRCYLRLVS
jgi:hypothetical protein